MTYDIRKIEKESYESLIQDWSHFIDLLRSEIDYISGKRMKSQYLDHEDLHSFGAFEDNQLRGFLSYREESDQFRVDQLIVDEKFHKKGVGVKLLDFLIHLTQSEDIEQVSVDLNVGQIGSLKFFIEEGFDILKYKKSTDYEQTGDEGSLQDCVKIVDYELVYRRDSN